MTDEDFARQERDIEENHGPDEVEDASWAVDLPSPQQYARQIGRAQQARIQPLAGTILNNGCIWECCNG